MTTVAYLNGILASDSLYNDGMGVDIAQSKDNALELSPPKIVKYKFDEFVILCGCAGVSNLMAATQDFFVENYKRLSSITYKDLVRLELPNYLDQFVTDSQRADDKRLLEVILVTCSDTSVLHYNIKEKCFYLPNDQFPAIGSGAEYVKEVYSSIPSTPCPEIVSRAIEKDCRSGGEIKVTSLSELHIGNYSTGLVINYQQEPFFLKNLNVLMGF